jgi:membrane protease YdiL (CAAX protease family)
MDATQELAEVGAGGVGPEPRPHRVAAQILPVLAVFIAVIVMHMVAGIAVFAALAGFDSAPAALTPELLVAIGTVTSTIFLVVGLAAGMASRAGVARSLRLAPGRFSIGMTLVSIFVFICLSQTADSALDLTGWAQGSLLADMTHSLSQATGATLVAAVLAIGLGGGIAEEVFFRGWMQTRLRPALGAWPAILITAAAFGLMHFDFVHSPVALLFGIFLGWITEKAGSILPAIAVHSVNNIMAVLGAALLPVPVASTPHLLLTALLLPSGVVGVALIARRFPGFAPTHGAATP